MKSLYPILLGAALFVQAQDDPFAAFEELEADAAAAAAKGEAGVIGKLGENLSGSVELEASHYFNDRTPMPGGDRHNNFWNTQIELETFTGGDNWKAGAAVTVQQGNQDNTFHDTSFRSDHFYQDTGEESHRYLRLDELYIIRNYNSWDLTLGKKVFPNGLSTIFSPADTLTPRCGYDPLTVTETGVWQIRTDFYQNRTTWTFALLPVYQPNKVPPSTSRWIIDTSGAPAPVTDYPSEGPNNFGYFGRVKTVQRGWDLFASCYAGPGRQYVIEQTGPVTRIRHVPDVVQPAVGYSTTRGAWEFHGEVVYTDSLRGEDEDYITVVQGTTRTFDGDAVKKTGLEQIEATVEAAWEWTVADQTASGFVQDSSSSRIGQRDLFGRLKFKFSEEVDVEYFGHMMLKNWGYMNQVKLNWEILNNLTWTTGVSFFGGNDKSGTPGIDNLALTYGDWRRNNHLFTSLKYEF